MEMLRVVIVTRVNAHKNAAVFDSRFIFGCIFFRYAATNERADQTAGQTARARAH